MHSGVKRLTILGAMLGIVPAYSMTPVYPDQEAYALSAEEQDTIEAIADAAEQEVRSVLPELRKDLTLEVRIGPWVPETGVAGSATGPRTIWMMVDPTRDEGVTGLVQRHLRTLIFHESHHLVRVWTDSGRSTMSHVASGRLIDRVISEGMATVFARDFANGETPWSEYPEEIEEWVQEVLSLPDDADQERWMFEHPDGREYVGYRAGAYIVERAVERSGRSAAELALVSTDEVIRLAGFR